MHKYISLIGAAVLSLSALQASTIAAGPSQKPSQNPPPAAKKQPKLMSLSSLRTSCEDTAEFSIFGSYIGGVAGISNATLGTSGFFSASGTNPTGTIFDLPANWGNGGRVELGFSSSPTGLALALSYEFFTDSASRTATAIPSTDPHLYPNLPTSKFSNIVDFVTAYEGTTARYHLKYSQVIDLLFTGPALVSPGCRSVLESSVGARGFFIHHDYNTTILTSALGGTSTALSCVETIDGVGAIAELFMRQNLFGNLETFSFGLQAKPTLGLVWGHHKVTQAGSQSVGGAASTPVVNVNSAFNLMHALVDAEIGLYTRFGTSMAAFEFSASILGEYWPDFSYLLSMGPTAGQPSTFSVVALLVTIGAIF
ncbi:MAG: hypothetical protein JSR76_01730 [Verrucomicrobia bacterium]|nr:hypothetical protein [Verrucomicrobiota bacterium]